MTDTVKASPVPKAKLERADYKEMFYGKARTGLIREVIEQFIEVFLQAVNRKQKDSMHFCILLVLFNKIYILIYRRFHVVQYFYSYLHVFRFLFIT